MAYADQTQEPIMSTAISDNIQSLMSDFGVDLTDLNSTDLLAELVIDTFDHWSNPSDAFAAVQTPSICGRDFEVAAQLD